MITGSLHWLDSLTDKEFADEVNRQRKLYGTENAARIAAARALVNLAGVPSTDIIIYKQDVFDSFGDMQDCGAKFGKRLAFKHVARFCEDFGYKLRERI